MALLGDGSDGSGSLHSFSDVRLHGKLGRRQPRPAAGAVGTGLSTVVDEREQYPRLRVRLHFMIVPPFRVLSEWFRCTRRATARRRAALRPKPLDSMGVSEGTSGYGLGEWRAGHYRD